MKITVILCTYNRCQSLRTALDSVASSVFPNSTDWEVVVVDNNSNDATSEVVRDFCHRSPQHFRYLFEPKQGKSNALNSGVSNTDADVIAFMDDDVTVEPDWLCNLTKVLASGEWAGAGGRILPTGCVRNRRGCGSMVHIRLRHLRCSISVQMVTCSPSRHSEPTWLFGVRCFKSTADFAKTWGPARAASAKMRIRNLGAD